MNRWSVLWDSYTFPRARSLSREENVLGIAFLVYPGVYGRSVCVRWHELVQVKVIVFLTFLYEILLNLLAYQLLKKTLFRIYHLEET